MSYLAIAGVIFLGWTVLGVVGLLTWPNDQFHRTMRRAWKNALKAHDLTEDSAPSYYSAVFVVCGALAALVPCVIYGPAMLLAAVGLRLLKSKKEKELAARDESQRDYELETEEMVRRLEKKGELVLAQVRLIQHELNTGEDVTQQFDENQEKLKALTSQSNRR